MRPLLILAIPLFFAAQAHSQERITDKTQIQTVFKELEERRKSIGSEKAVVEMVITDSQNRIQHSHTLQFWKKNNAKESMSLYVISYPESLRGTSFLSITEADNRIQQLYHPSIGQIQTLDLAEKSNRFMSSDFTYEDLGGRISADYIFEWLEIYDTHYTIRATKSDSDKYAYLEFEIIKATYVVRTIRFFDESDTMIKYLESENFEQLTDKLWSPNKITVHDLQKNRKTELNWSNRVINPFIRDSRFSEQGLRAGI